MIVHREEYIRRYEPFWGSWYIDAFVGEGSYGKVYKIYKTEWGYKYESALKIITIPTKNHYKEAAISSNSSEDAIESYLEDICKNIANETRLLYSLRGNSNIVSYEDHCIIKRKGEIGWDILIRMEYLKCLPVFIAETSLTRPDVIRLGIDICTALELCAKHGIVHRDIKDENIFVTSDGKFKLGDFSIARELSESEKASSVRGTPFYLAPEVFKGQQYDSRADLYSLGIVLYKLLNQGRLPFMPSYPQQINYIESTKAFEKRISGEKLLHPSKVGIRLGEIILKVCEYSPGNRYSSASELKSTFEKALLEMDIAERNETITFVSEKSKAQIEQESQDVNDISIEIGTKQSNTSVGNIINGGTVAEYNDWIYYLNTGTDCKLYKINKDSAEKIKLNDNSAWFINAADGWIYYSNESEGDSLYKISSDGKVRIKLNNDKCWYINVVDTWVYYCNENDNFSIYKIKIDGTGKTKLNSDESYDINVTGNSIYYSNKSDDGNLYKIKTDGSGKSQLNTDTCSCVNVIGEWIYYCNRSDGYSLYKIKTDGSSGTKLDNSKCRNVNANGLDGYIYYCNTDDNCRLYKISMDGRCKAKLNDDYCDYISIIENWVYYCNKGDNNKLYKIRTDGSGRAAMDENEAGRIDVFDGWIYL